MSPMSVVTAGGNSGEINTSRENGKRGDWAKLKMSLFPPILINAVHFPVVNFTDLPGATSPRLLERGGFTGYTD